MIEQELLEKIVNKNTVMICRFGSSLYGTRTPDSDIDYKGIEITDIDRILLGDIPKHHEYYSSGENTSKNTSEDIDIEIFSLHEFIKLALQGQTCAFDMLHVNKENLLFSSPIWEAITRYKEKLYSKNIESFIGYAMGQAAKYGCKGSRLNDLQIVIEILNKHV